MQARKLLFWAGSDGVFISFGYFIAYAGVRVGSDNNECYYMVKVCQMKNE